MSTLLPLPISPTTAIKSIIRPALTLLPERMTSDAAIVLVLAIMLQESGLAHRWQIVDARHPEKKGPARGLAQFELGGVSGVCKHTASSAYAAALCRAVDPAVTFEPRAIWEALDDNDILAAGMARLLLFTDAAPLPEVGAADAAWSYYQRNWRPGAFANGDATARALLRSKFIRNYATAKAALSQ